MAIRRFAAALSLLVAFALAGCGGGNSNEDAKNAPPGPPAPAFANPQRVTIAGYDGDATEPALSPDGRFLFFNDAPADDNRDLFYAERIDDLHFQFKGRIAGANSDALDGVASMDNGGTLYWVSTRSYDETLSTIYRGSFADGAVSNVALVPGLAAPKRGSLNFDATISADGNTLYYAQGTFALITLPLSGDIRMATRTATGFATAENSGDILATVNADGAAYAPTVSKSGLEIFFNRIDGTTPVIYTATRASTSVPFGGALKVNGISGFAEGPALSPDEKSLYYQRMDDGKFVLYRATR